MPKVLKKGFKRLLEEANAKIETIPTKEALTLAGDDSVVLVKARAEIQDDGKARLLASDVLPLEQAKLAEARHVTIRVPLGTWDRGKGERLRDILGSHRGDCPVTLELFQPEGLSVAIAPSAMYRVRPNATLQGEVEALLGPGSLTLTVGNGRNGVKSLPAAS